MEVRGNSGMVEGYANQKQLEKQRFKSVLALAGENQMKSPEQQKVIEKELPKPTAYTIGIDAAGQIYEKEEE